MSGLYLTDLPSVLNPTGVTLGWQDGWQSRSRSSGGYQFGGPWCVMWHHTAGAVSDSAWNAANYGSHSSDSRPIANAYIDDTGLCVIAAAGCTNTNGKGGPWRLPDGRTVPLDDMNRYAFGIEICNNGVGEPYSAAQIDACFKISNAICKRYISGRYNNVCEHINWAPGRKIDPATAAAVQGPWDPRSVNANGTWNLADLQAECLRRGGGTPPPSGGSALITEMENKLHYYIKPENEKSSSTVWISDGTYKWAAHSGTQLDMDRFFQEVRLEQMGLDKTTAKGYSNLIICDKPTFYAFGINIDPTMTGRDSWGWNN